MAGTGSAKVVQIFLKTELKDIKQAVTAANGKKGFIEVNINSKLTWMELFINHNIIQSGDLIVKNDAGDITSQLTETIKSYTEKYKTDRHRFTARIMKKSMLRTPIVEKRASPAKSKSPPPKRTRSEFVSPISPAKKRGRPAGRTNAPKKPASPAKTQANNISAQNVPPQGNAMEQDPLAEVLNGNTANGRVSNGNAHTHNASNNDGHDLRNIGPTVNGDQLLRDDADSLFSIATRDGPSTSRHNHAERSFEVKSAVVESFVKCVTESMLWRVKDEYDHLQEKGIWMRLCSSHMPQLGNFINHLLQDKHFRPPTN